MRTIVVEANCIFHDIHQENDFGIDGFIEFVDQEVARGVTVAAQIRTGRSFSTARTCSIRGSRGHFAYWRNHSLPVLGIVVDLENREAHWIDLRQYLREHPQQASRGPFTITFEKNELNRLHANGFSEIVLPTFLGKPIAVARARSEDFVRSSDPRLAAIGVASLVAGARDEEAFSFLLDTLHDRPHDELPPQLVAALALVPGHPDIFWHSGNVLSDEVRGAVRERLAQLDEDDVVKLLALVDNDGGFSRGSIGQNVEAVISVVKRREQILESIALNGEMSPEIRANALTLLSFYLQEAAIPLLQRLMNSDLAMSEWARTLNEYFYAEGYFYLY